MTSQTFIFSVGGGGGIRTHVRQKGESGFQDRHHKPLGHPSWLKILLQIHFFRQSCRPFAGVSTRLWPDMDDIRAGGLGITGYMGDMT
jgi:hypothetical protein